MRRLVLLSLCLVSVFSASAFAADGAKNYGNTICIKNTECPNREADRDKLISQGISCAGRYFGFKREVFDEVRGIDLNGCLVAKGTQTFGTSPVAMEPKCCYEENEEGKCQLRCEVFATE